MSDPWRLLHSSRTRGKHSNWVEKIYRTTCRKSGNIYNFCTLNFFTMTLLPRQKRFLIALPLGIVAGIVCTYLASGSTPGIWWTALMWTIITNRFVIGLVVGLAGAYTRHPVFNFPMPSYLRGFCLWVFVSLSLATGYMINTGATWTIFSATLVAWGIYGSIIDMLATKFGGQGKDMIG